MELVKRFRFNFKKSKKGRYATFCEGNKMINLKKVLFSLVRKFFFW